MDVGLAVRVAVLAILREHEGAVSPTRRYRIADNKLALNASWDNTLLDVELVDLQTMGFDVGLTGFTKDEINALSAGAVGQTDPDQVPDPLVDPVSAASDLWNLGVHRLLCGDATSAEDVKRAFGAHVPHLMVTDPPYGVDYDPDWRNRADRIIGKPCGVRAIGRVTNNDRADWREAWSLFPGDVAYVWHAGVHARVVAESLEVCGFRIRSQIVWAKPRFVLSRGDYHWQHEPCWYAVREGATGHWQGARDQSTVWSVGAGEEDEATVHGTQKPVECMRRPILNNSAKGDAIYEPFCGSGTTLIAAETTGRVCLGIEIDPAYVDVAVKRWQNLTGRTALLEGDGRTFVDLTQGHRAA